LGLGSGFEPVLKLSSVLHKVDLVLLELEVGVEEIEVALTLLNEGVLLVLGGHLLATAVAYSETELNLEGIELVLGELAVEGGKFDAGRELLGGVVEFDAALGGLITKKIGFGSGVGRVGGGFAALGAKNGIYHGEVKRDAEVYVVGVVMDVVLGDVVEG